MACRRIARAALALLACLSAAACDLLFDRKFSWQEEVLLSDGSSLSVQREVTRQGLCSASLPGSCQVLSSTLRAEIQGLGKVRFDLKGPDWPVVFDVIAGRPWIVLPIAGLDACQTYGNPPESVVAFTGDGAQWFWKPYAEAPRALKFNLTRGIPMNEETRVTLKTKRYDPEHGRELDQHFIPRHVKWEHSCPRLNPPATPEYEQALRNFMDTPWVALKGRVVKTSEDPVALTLEEHRTRFGMPGDQHGIVGCSGKVSHKQSIFSTRRGESGTTGTLAAYRIALAPGGSPAIFLPANAPTPRSHIARIACAETLIYVVLRQDRDAVGVVAYDLQGERKNAWRIHMPDLAVPADNWGSVIDFADRGDRFELQIGEYQHHQGAYGPAKVATLGKRYVVDAPK